MEESKEVNTGVQAPATGPLRSPGETLSQGLDEAMFKLLQFQAQQGADPNSTMLMLALMNLLGIVNCMNKILPEVQRVRGTQDLASQMAGMLGGVVPPPSPQPTPQGAQGGGGIDPAMLAALAGMLGGPRGPEGAPEGNRPGIDPGMIAALASMLGGPGGGGGGANPAALMAMLANFMGPKRHPEAPKPKETPSKEEVPEQPEEKGKNIQEPVKKEMGPPPRGMLKWDSRFGSPSSF